MLSYWLIKSEPDVFSYAHLRASPGGTAGWDGVRNFEARNAMQSMRAGDRVLFYHSQARPTAVVGLARVVREAYPDPSQFDPASPYHDPTARPEAPRWFQVDVQAELELPRPVTLETIRADPALEGMALLKRGSRLSVQPVAPEHWARVLELGGAASISAAEAA